MLIVKLMLFSLENDIMLFITSYTVYVYVFIVAHKEIFYKLDPRMISVC